MAGEPQSLERHVRVPVTGLWIGPGAPRDIDAAMLLDEPDHAGWLRRLDAEPDLAGRLGLVGRLESELLAGEPAVVLEPGPEWTRIAARWQPQRSDVRGYPGWVRTAHLAEGEAPATPPPTRLRSAPDANADAHATTDEPAFPSAEDVLAVGRSLFGLPYLWGGIGADGLDCSGLIHYCYRAFGVITPRDADDQSSVCTPIAGDEALPGDLYFFAYPGKSIHHVGFVTGPGRILHAPRTGQVVVEEPMDIERQDTLVGFGRLTAAALATGTPALPTREAAPNA